MTSPHPTPSKAAALAAAALLLAGCHSGGSSSIAAQFMASPTVASPGLVKLVQKSRSGSRLVVDAVIYGPSPALDLYGFRFGVKIGNTAGVKFVPQASYVQSALVAGTGQTVAVTVDDSMADPSLVEITISKTGGGTGNGIAGTSAVVIELAFDVNSQLATTLALVGEGNNPPEALDSANAPIPAVTFDTANATVRGVSTGGGGGY